MRKAGKRVRKRKVKDRGEAALPWKSRIIGHESVDPRVLLANPKNFRTHGERQRAVMGEAIQRIGFINSVIVNKVTGKIINGHMRVDEAIFKGQESIPVVWVELTEEEEAIALATFDPISELAEVDSVILGNLLRDAVASDADIAAVMEVVAEDQGVEDYYFMDHHGERSESDAEAVGRAERYLVVFYCTEQDYAEELSRKISEAGFDCYVKIN